MKAGFGRCDITPRVGVELYGFGPFLNRKSIGVRDILEARSAALECGGHTVIIVSLDLCALHVPEIIVKIRSCCGNDVCAECGAKNPEWAVIKFGILI